MNEKGVLNVLNRVNEVLFGDGSEVSLDRIVELK